MAVQWCWIVILLAIISHSLAFVPESCGKNVSNAPAVCCPTPKGYSNPCGYPLLGTCIKYQAYEDLPIKKLHYFYPRDVRMFWPMRVFQFGCSCRGRFWGPDCSECWYGFEGRNCDRKTMYTRRSAMTYTARDKQLFVNVSLMAAKLPSKMLMPRIRPDENYLRNDMMEGTILQEISYLHWTLAYPRITKNHTLCKGLTDLHLDFGHYYAAFLTAHRYLLLYWERLYRNIAKKYFGATDFSFPYWDWTDAKTCEVCTDDFVGSENETFVSPRTDGWHLSSGSPFSKWKIRCADCSPLVDFCKSCHIDHGSTDHIGRRWKAKVFPTNDQILNVIKLKRYFWPFDLCASFSHMMEAGLHCLCEKDSIRPVQLHAEVHTDIAGTFNPVATSPYDGLFILHHTQIDRLFELWMRGREVPISEYPPFPFAANQCRNCRIAGFYPIVNHRDMFTDSRRMGYNYSDFDFGRLKSAELFDIMKREYPYKAKNCKKTEFNLV